jgi:hypothetical protein
MSRTVKGLLYLHISIYGIISIIITLNEFSASYNSILLGVLFEKVPTADINP